MAKLGQPVASSERNTATVPEMQDYVYERNKSLVSQYYGYHWFVSTKGEKPIMRCFELGRLGTPDFVAENLVRSRAYVRAVVNDEDVISEIIQAAIARKDIDLEKLRAQM
jgi:hypothetical protein